MDDFYIICSDKFQSTPSARRATRTGRAGGGRAVISIHALREESDNDGPGRWVPDYDFNPRPPRGERRATRAAKLTSTRFQSTPSARRAT